MSRTRTPVVDGWFTEGPAEDSAERSIGDTEEAAAFRLLGTRCAACRSVFFPREDTYCRNPDCSGGALEEVPLSRRGRIWSYTDAQYRPPAPYVSDPDAAWQPYVLVAVELAAERMVVLGQAVPGTATADLAVGMEVEVVPGLLNEDGETSWTTWHWKPVPDSGAGPDSEAGPNSEAGLGA